MRNTVLEYLKGKDTGVTEQFNEGFYIAQKVGVSPNILARYNKRGATAENVQNIRYDLQKHLGITDAEIDAFIVEELPELLPVEFKKDSDHLGIEENGGGKLIDLEPFTAILQEMNDAEKTGFKMSAQYPFLRDKEVPNELKILVNDAITAFDSYKTAHQELFDKLVVLDGVQLNEAEVYKIAESLLADFELNREIHAELQHYADTKEILGEHPIFSALKLQREVEAILPEELGRKRQNIASNISKKKEKLKGEQDPKAILLLKGEIKSLEQHRDLIDVRIQAAKSDGDKNE